MGPRRFQPPPPLVYSTRSSIDSEKHSDVDAALKQLKTCTRRLQAALSAHRTELQVLERLYYKGKNQHRQALFWRRVEETRKYGERLNGMAMHELVEALRLSFWGDAWREKPKLLRGPWTHVPNKEVGLHVLRRCSDCLSLIRKSHERLVNAYQSFLLVMQTGAFLQLVLTLAAIVSRLDMLLAEVESSLEISLSACFRILSAVDSASAGKIQHLVRSSPQAPIKPVPAVRVPGPAVAPIPEVHHDEDVGSTLQRSEALRDEGSSSLVSSTDFLRNTEDDVIHLSEDVLGTVFTPAVQMEVHNVQKIQVTGTLPSTTSISMKRKSAECETPVQIKPPKKKKKKRDEIDDIFGF